MINGKLKRYKSELLKLEREMWRCEDEAHEIMCYRKSYITDFVLDMFCVTLIYAIAIADICTLCM